MRNWQMIPMREFSNLCVIKEEGGEVIATVQNHYAEVIQALPELLEASREIFERLAVRQKEWEPASLLGRLERAISRMQPANGTVI